MLQWTSNRTWPHHRHGKTLACILICAWLLALGLLAPLGSPTQADDGGRATGAQTYAKLYDDICYSNLPDFAPIYALAKKRNWTEITGTALQAFAPDVPPDDLKAWWFLVDGVKFHLSISSGPADKALQATVPEFAKSRAFACSLILPGQIPQSAMDQALTTLVGRPPDTRYESAPFNVHFWSGITDQLAALMYHYKPKSGAPGGLISFVVLKK